MCKTACSCLGVATAEFALLPIIQILMFLSLGQISDTGLWNQFLRTLGTLSDTGEEVVQKKCVINTRIWLGILPKVSSHVQPIFSRKTKSLFDSILNLIRWTEHDNFMLCEPSDSYNINYFCSAQVLCRRNLAVFLLLPSLLLHDTIQLFCCNFAWRCFFGLV